MRHLHIKHHWLGRLLASDPGRKRFQQAGKATISLVTSIFIMQALLQSIGNELFTPIIVAGMLGLMGIMVVMDDTKKEQQITTLLLFVAATVGVTIGSVLSSEPTLVGGAMVLAAVGAFYFSRFAIRYFSLGLIGFFTIYFSSYLNLSLEQLPWFFIAVGLGTCSAYLFNFVIFRSSAHVLRRSMRSYHIQANLTLNMLISFIANPNTDEKQTKKLERNVSRLNDYARQVSEDLNEEDITVIYPGIDVSQLRLYVFDTGMLVETLTDAIERLKDTDALDVKELRRLLVWIVRALRDARVLDPSYEQENLREAEEAVQAVRLLLQDLLSQENEQTEWLFLIRRIESIANHVIGSAVKMQQAMQTRKQKEENNNEKKDTSEEKDLKPEQEEEGLKPTTKKAYQALVACSIALVTGYIISPIQPYWVILTTFLVLIGTESIGRTYTKGFQRSVGTVIGAVLGFAIAKVVSGHVYIEVTSLFIVVFLAFYFMPVSYTVMSLFITILIAFLYDLLLGGISFQLLGARVIDTIAGAAIALSVSTVIFPTKTKDKVADAFGEYVTELDSYLSNYVKRFLESVNIKLLSGSAFILDQKLKAIKDQSQSLLQRPAMFNSFEFDRLITGFIAINYYAKQLVASSYKKDFYFPNDLVEDFKQIEKTLQHNTRTLMERIDGTNLEGKVRSLDQQRERIERFAPGNDESQRDIIHHLYYVWKINETLLVLSKELGAKEEEL